jgi:hypothetical protein
MKNVLKKKEYKLHEHSVFWLILWEIKQKTSRVGTLNRQIRHKIILKEWKR